jgi:hypothetical protein
MIGFPTKIIGFPKVTKLIYNHEQGNMIIEFSAAQEDHWITVLVQQCHMIIGLLTEQEDNWIVDKVT